MAGSIQKTTSGLALHLEAAGLLLRTRRLWFLAAIPVLISLITIGIALGLIFGNAAVIFEFLTAWMPVLEASHWYSWLWIGPAKAFEFLAGGVLFIAATVLALVGALLTANVLAGPVLDELSKRVEKLVSGAIDEVESVNLWAFFRDNVRIVWEDLRRILFFGAVQAAIWFLGMAIPGAQLVAPVAMVFVVILFLPLEYTAYTLDRRQLSFRERRSWALSHKPEMLGFGSGAFLVCMVPGLNFLAMPIFVVSGTLLVLRLAEKSEAESPPRPVAAEGSEVPEINR